ncbi:MAG: TatD family hydrolase [Heliobacteriaceae bacterium]|nr:TatD family hydrolase [Heliobacteriaceae bacterium]
MRLFDTHAHLDDGQFREDRDQVVQQARTAGVELIVNVGCDLVSSRQSIALATAYPFIYAAVGIHPHDAANMGSGDWAVLAEMAGHPRVVAIGEIGLDFYRDRSPRPAQREVFSKQLALARRLKKPVIIHDRDAHGEVMDILKRQAGGLTGVLHCFSGSWEMAQFCLRLGFYISIAGPVTYLNSRQLPEIARKVPRDRLLIETDCPYLTPHPWRGKRNDPSFVRLVAEKVAAVRGEDPAELAWQTLVNGCTLFGIPVPGYDPTTI